MIFISCMVVLLLSSCASRKGIAYLQDMELGQRYLYDARYEAPAHSNEQVIHMEIGAIKCIAMTG